MGGLMPKSEADIDKQYGEAFMRMIDQISALQLAVQVLAQTRPDQTTLQEAFKAIKFDLRGDPAGGANAHLLQIVEDAEAIVGLRKKKPQPTN